MPWVDLRAGYACNNQCRFCDQGDARERLADAPLPALEAALAAAQGREGVWLAGGEITLRRDLPALIQRARALGYRRVGLQTNGRVLAAAGAAEALGRAGLTDVAVAIHAPGAAVHDWLVGAPGAFAQSAAGARRVAAAGLTLHLTTVLTRPTTEVLPALAALAIRLGARGHRWIHPRAEGSARGEERALVPRFALLARPLAQALGIEREARVEADVVGVPLCVLGPLRAQAADRPDLPGPERVFPAGWSEPRAPRAYAPACGACPLRAGCPGVDPDYLARWGGDELLPPTGAPPRPERAEVWLDAASGAQGARGARQALVRAVGGRAVCFAGPDPWAHPALPALVRDAGRLGLEAWVRGPLDAVAALEPPALERLSALTGVEATEAPEALVARLRAVAPALRVERPG